MPRMTKTLLKADTKVIYLDNKASEKVSYLAIDMELNKKSLLYDIKNGASHFSEVKEFLEKKNKSRMIVISSDTKENGLMAVSYLAACMNQASELGEMLDEYDGYLIGEKNPFEEISCDEEEDYYNVGSSWCEDVSRIPLIEAGELRSYITNGGEDFNFGGYMGRQRSDISQRKPYWTSCKKEAVCILCDPSQGNCLTTEILALFQNNANVFLVFFEQYSKDELVFELPFDMSGVDFEKMKNSLILTHSADELYISMKDTDAKRYYTTVMKQNLKSRGIKVQKGFSYERAIHLAMSLNRHCVCGMLDVIINYALKDFPKEEKITLKNSDFDFVDRFQRTEKKQEKEKAVYRLEHELVGMEAVKEQVMDTVNVMKYNKLRADRKISGSKYHNVHVMLGAPGTAKTTVAQIMGQIMMEEKLISDNRFICVNGAELKGQYVGQSAPKTKALFDNYDVIIIDEAYSLVEGNGSTDSFSGEAIAQLIIELEKHSTDKLIIFAGYGGKDVSKKNNKMKNFLEANPGIKSRITSTFYFESYSAKDMAEIFKRIAELANYKIEKDSLSLVEQYFLERVNDKEFGNGREARSLLETSVVFAAKRLMESGKIQFTEEELMVLKQDDIKKAIKKQKEAFGIRDTGTDKIIGFAV